jgi:3-oxoacyl-[acyl-carrier protein] reductase
MDLQLRGKVALVTGASRGIGRAIAIALAGEGADIALCARGAEGLEAIAGELREMGVRVFAEVADVTDAGALQQFVDGAAAALGRLDILINNVGGSKGTGVMDSTDEEWLGTFDLNLFHAVRASRAALPHMRRQGGGSIVTISSISGYRSAPGSQYGCAKAAEIFLSGAMALELGSSNVRVNTVCPGSILFPGGGWARYQERDPEGFRRFREEEFPLGRLGTAEEVARVVVFVASPAGSWINGALVPVDGGQQRPGVFSLVPR